MKERELMEKLNEKAVFSVQDIERIADASKGYAKLILNRLTKRKLIKKITKNAYTSKKDILVLATNLKIPSYLSFWSASSYYGFTEQILNTIYVATTRRIKPINFEGYKIKFIRTKDFFGYRKIKTNEGELFIAEQERLLIDSLLYWKEMGNFDEIENVFKKAEVSKEKIIEYLKRINNLSLIKRIGYLLDNYKNMDISKSFKMDRNYIFLNPFLNKYKSLNSKWMVKI
jgi:predicted transcriptional regulator of viral defense system